MPGWVEVLLGVGAGIVLLWLALALTLLVQARRAGRSVDWREAARIVPDVVRLLRRLTADPAVSRRTRIVLLVLLGYLLLPIDLIPDFIPLLGYADDAIVVAIALRLAVRNAGRQAVERNWPGTEFGLAGILRLAGIRA